jgi:hypothetical protein
VPLSPNTKTQISLLISANSLMNRDDLKGLKSLSSNVSTRTEHAVSTFFKLAPPKKPRQILQPPAIEVNPLLPEKSKKQKITEKAEAKPMFSIMGAGKIGSKILGVIASKEEEKQEIVPPKENESRNLAADIDYSWMLNPKKNVPIERAKTRQFSNQL